MNLYSLTAKYEYLLSLESLDAEQCAELESLNLSIQDHCIAKAKLIKNLEAEAAAVKGAIDEMKERYESLMSRASRETQSLINRMEVSQINEITSSPLFAIKIKENPVSVLIEDEEKVPFEYWRETTPKPVKSLDKKALKAAIEFGVFVPGATLIRNKKLEIK